MTTTANYATWNEFDPSSTELAASIGAALGEYASDYDLDAIETDVRAAIDEALPEGVTLHGREVIGPYDTRHQEIDYPGIWDGIDFWTIAERHDRTA